MNRTPAVFVLAVAVAPLVWAACGAPQEGASSPPTSGSAEPVVSVAPGSSSADPGASAGPTSTPDVVTWSSPKTAAKPLTKDACERLRTVTINKVDIARKLSQACAKDADCQIEMDGSCLQTSCGTSIAKSQAATFRESARAINEPACAEWNAGGCPSLVPIPIASCPMLIAECKGGQCASHY